MHNCWLVLLCWSSFSYSWAAAATLHAHQIKIKSNCVSRQSALIQEHIESHWECEKAMGRMAKQFVRFTLIGMRWCGCFRPILHTTTGRHNIASHHIASNKTTMSVKLLRYAYDVLSTWHQIESNRSPILVSLVLSLYSWLLVFDNETRLSQVHFKFPKH